MVIKITVIEGELYMSEELIKKENNEIVSAFGLDVVLNELHPTELIENGYRKMEMSEVVHIEPLIKMAPQLITDKINKSAVEHAFKEATANSYKCILDPTKHLATIKGTTDVYIGAALDNNTNQLAGQARWLKNDAQLSVSNSPNIISNSFNALSFVTGQYFISQVNSNLKELHSGINEIKTYLEAIEESQLETAVQELNGIFGHLQFIRTNTNRINHEIVQLDNIRNISKNSINLHKRQIDNIMKSATFSDKEAVIVENITNIRKSLIQYQLAVNVYNVAHILKIYLSGITDVDELCIYRDELEDLAVAYRSIYQEAIMWTENYLDNTNVLNKASVMQKIMSLGTGVAFTFIGGKNNIYNSYKAGLLVNDYFNKKRGQKKIKILDSHNNYKCHMSDIRMVESSIAVMDEYINATRSPVEIVMCENEYYIKYLSSKDKEDEQEP